MIVLGTEEGQRLHSRMSAIKHAGSGLEFSQLLHKLATEGLTREEADNAWDYIRESQYG